MDGISVVTPCYNGARHLRECLDSVLGQEVDCPLEVLVCDDGSTDQSREIVAGYGPPVRLLTHPGGANRGVSATRNRCLAEARHAFVAFLDADDVWLPGHLRGLYDALTACPDAGLAYADCSYLMPDGSVTGRRFPPGHRPVTAGCVLLDCSLVSSGVMVRRALLDRVGGFQEDLWGSEDQDLWVRVLEHSRAVFVPRRTFLYRQHAAQMTGSVRLWQAAEQVVERARRRGLYPPRLLRRREAVIRYRLGQAALAQRRYAAAAWRWLCAAWLDPARAWRAVLGRAAPWTREPAGP